MANHVGLWARRAAASLVVCATVMGVMFSSAGAASADEGGGDQAGCWFGPFTVTVDGRVIYQSPLIGPVPCP